MNTSDDISASPDAESALPTLKPGHERNNTKNCKTVDHVKQTAAIVLAAGRLGIAVTMPPANRFEAAAFPPHSGGG